MAFNSEAVIFFDDQHRIVKEMIYAEFEAVLDQVVGVQDFSGQELQAVYLQINAYLEITAAVFFLIDFDKAGFAAKNWNIPLVRLAETGGRGPDMGAGPIRLSCRSQCSIGWHQHSLWDPLVEDDRHSLRLLAMAVKRNRLGLDVQDKPGPVPPVVSQKVDETGQLKKQWQKKFQEKVQALLDEQKLRIAAIKTQAQTQLSRLQEAHAKELADLHNALQQARQGQVEEQKKNALLKKTLEQQAEEFAVTRKGIEQAFSEAKQIDNAQWANWQASFAREKQASIDSATAELKEMIQMRDAELFYRQEEIAALRDELAVARLQQQKLAELGEQGLIRAMVDQGVNFVVLSHDGEQVSIPAEDIALFVQSPQDYMADHCRVERDLYGQWLAHFELPLCNHLNDDGRRCGRPIAKVVKPALFVPGESDRCAQHAGLTTIVAEAVRAS